MTARRKRKSNNPRGRPSDGLSEVKVLVPMPALLREIARVRAAEEGVAVTEWWRRAGRVRAGLLEVPPTG